MRTFVRLMDGSLIPWMISAGAPSRTRVAPDDVDDFIRYDLGSRMGRTDHDVTSFDSIYNLTSRGQAGVRRRDEGSNDTGRFSVFHKTLCRVFFDNANTRLTQAVTENQFDFVSLISLRYFIAKRGFVNGFVTYRSPDLHIADSSCNSLAETVNTLLIVRCNDIKGRMGTGNHFIDLSNLFRGNFFCHK